MDYIKNGSELVNGDTRGTRTAGTIARRGSLGLGRQRFDSPPLGARSEQAAWPRVGDAPADSRGSSFDALLTDHEAEAEYQAFLAEAEADYEARLLNECQDARAYNAALAGMGVDE